ncbi:MlaD family protein [Mycobacterium sp. CVI_P3]|uniref:MlaD family protein n=1 Tax=Mycobacterium pinniadriaticum TaxID=2994102 RepID=A0ABT3SN70_9MYCO|nr:MlaD family protein [Mycobacterium pinniadriaticum]MCX2934553.1 MlaD family protein [Mycobacterium pinniadriaticum]MCX2940976.1 MlaD family protein [Mycobacterium pinniadriaticum]
MLTRFIRIQLVIFAVISVVGLATMVIVYLQAPTLLGIGRITVKLELPASGGLYRFSNVTYRGTEVGKVTGVKLTRTGAEATMSLASQPKIPADLRANVRSVSAVGEQYIDLLPRVDSGPYLVEGSIIPVGATTIPQQVGPLLDRVDKLVNTIPKDKLSDLLDESFKAFNGAGYDIGSLLDSSATITHDMNGVVDPTRRLIDDGVPLLDAQANSADALRVWTRSLAGVSEQLVQNDPQIRTLLSRGVPAAQEVSQLLSQVKPTLPVLLANLTTIGQIAVTYNAGLEQLLVLFPPYVASTQSQSLINNPTGLPLGDFAMAMGDPPPCTVGYLPPSAWRSPNDTADIDTPDGLYCKLPQDSPSAVRGARNYPCAGKPGKRAPTVEICESDKPYEPLAMRQHVTGPYPIDPNLVSQGIPPDNRVTDNEHIFGPLEGTPRPGDAVPPPEPGPLPPTPADAEPPGPVQNPPAQPGSGGDPGAARAAPSAFTPGAQEHPTVVIAQYNPRTGRYMNDGQLYQQADLVEGAIPKSWKDMMPI